MPNMAMTQIPIRSPANQPNPDPATPHLIDKLAEVKSILVHNEAALSRLSSEITQLQSELKTNVGLMSSDISQLRSEVSQLRSEVTDHNDKLVDFCVDT